MKLFSYAFSYDNNHIATLKMNLRTKLSLSDIKHNFTLYMLNCSPQICCIPTNEHALANSYSKNIQVVIFGGCKFTPNDSPFQWIDIDIDYSNNDECKLTINKEMTQKFGQCDLFDKICVLLESKYIWMEKITYTDFGYVVCDEYLILFGGCVANHETTKYDLEKNKDLDTIYQHSIENGLNYGTDEGCWKSKQFTVSKSVVLLFVYFLYFFGFFL